MILSRCFFTSLVITALQNTGTANFLDAHDEQSCIDICESCEGTATFDYDSCECHVADDNQRGAECIYRMKRQAAKLGLDVVSCDLADPETDRAARCVISPFRRFRTGDDAELIANYFMGHGLGGLGSLLGSSKSQSEGRAAKVKDPYTLSTSENVGAKTPSSASDSNKESAAMVGAPNTFVGAKQISDQSVGMNSLLGAAAAWLQPSTLLAMRNGMQGAGTQGLVAQPSSQSSMYQNYGMDSAQENFVGSPHQEDSTNGLYSAYPNGVIVGSPYPYIVGAPYSVQGQDGVQMSPMQSYLYSYNSMVGAQNPVFGYNQPMPLVGAANPQDSDSDAAQSSGVNENLGGDKESVGAPNPEASLMPTENTDLGNQGEEQKNADKKSTEAVVGSVQSGDNLKEDGANAEETKLQSSEVPKRSIRRRTSRFRSKESAAKPESAIGA